ncbi:methylglyoxal synthase [Sedimentibacter sp. zth1]|uniref:methylglyoxal synthase n=1 Tax=Sedimentibacter sp. zth1 TaxID=2816908 RepID=UPI001A934448|nr:methylglyoxal synthase [Sedimentibacter sp. zth1]QSX06194.1 methylglyoxal synthase [Sedimentibacter sp. zth1]
MVELKPIGIKKNIALIAHDNLKDTMVNWCIKNKHILEKHMLCGTGTTAKRINQETGLNVYGYNSGPLGGDQQVGCRIAEGLIDMVIFFSDPLSAHPHDPDVKALLRLAQVFDIPMANSEATADFLITSPYMETEYTRNIMNIKL